MTLRLTLFTQEVEDFVLEILIDPETTFHELHRFILETCEYTDQGRHAFMICDEDWHVEYKIRQTDSGNLRSDEDLYLMAHTRIEEFVEDEGQHIAYVFDPQEKRFFLIELTENIFGKTPSEAHVSRRHGEAPPQFFTFTEEPDTPAVQNSEEIEEDFYGDEGFEADELDAEGFEINE